MRLQQTIHIILKVTDKGHIGINTMFLLFYVLQMLSA